MKRVYNKWYLKILSFFLVLLGFNSCGEEDPVVEYGVPMIFYKVNGKVVVAGQSTEPVQNIRVVLAGVEQTYPLRLHEKGDTVFTDSKGVFEFDYPDDYWEYPTDIMLIFEDVDGEENGSFATKQELIKLEAKDYEKEGSWIHRVNIDMGTVELAPKQEIGEEPED